MAESISMSPKRLPFSCENCRQRKIRCISAEGNQPCRTCTRRGYAASCRFKRPSEPNLPAAEQDQILSHDQNKHQILACQVTKLESLLRENIQITSTVLGQKREGRMLSPEISPCATAGSGVDPGGSPLWMPSGRLLVSASDHVRFVPFLDIGDSALLDAVQDPASSTTSLHLFANPPARGIEELLDLLPPSTHLDELKNAFFTVFSPLFHILHDPTFEAKYERFKKNPRSTPIPFLALVFVILGLAVTTLDNDHYLLKELAHNTDPSSTAHGLSANYRAAAMRCLVTDNFMVTHNLCTLQALVLLVYAMSHAQEPTWALLGVTMHIAVAIGCAVDPSHLNVDYIEAEERRRCWAALMMLYTIQNACMGNIMPFRIQSRVALPMDVEDEDVSPGASQPLSDDSVYLPPTRMSYLLYKFRLYNLAFDICQLSSSASDRRSMCRMLDEKLSWEQKCHTVRFANLTDLPSFHQAHQYILANYTHHLVLLLHRPPLSSAEADAEGVRYSALRCEAAAIGTLSNFEIFNLDVKLRGYRWYIEGLGSFYAFFAVTTLLVLYSSGQSSVELGAEILQLVLRSIRTLSQLSSRSSICTRAYALLEPIAQQLSRPKDEFGHSDSGDIPVYKPGVEGSCEFIPGLEHLFYDLPSEQWMAPVRFPWNIPHAAARLSCS